MLKYSFLSTILFFTTAVTLAIAVPAWQRRHWAGGHLLAALMTAVSLWSFAVGAESVSVVLRTKIFWSQVEYIGYGLTSSLFLLFVLQYTRNIHRLKPLWFAGLFTIPAITIALAWTNPLHMLLWSGFTYVETTNIVIYHRGPWFWVFAGYTYLLSAISIGVLIRAYIKACPHHKTLYCTIILSAVFPLLTGILYMIGWVPFKGMGIAPLGFAATGCILSWSMHHRQLLGLIPVGRAMLIEHMSEGVILLDTSGCIADINPAAKRLLSSSAGSPMGHTITDMFVDVPGISSFLENTAEGVVEISMHAENGPYLEVTVTSVRDSRRLRGRLVIIRDITGQKRAECERERLVTELRHALTRVQTLQGLLPICSVCKKIRDEHGEWHNIETYIRNRTMAEFTHEYCPECASKR